MSIQTKLEAYFQSLQNLNVDNKNIVLDNRIINQKEVNLIIIGDNPGKKEFDNKIYFSEEGSAGKFLKSFKTLLESTESNYKNVLLLNKTAYHSDTTDKLIINEHVKKSILLTVDLINDIISLKPDLKILITGLAKNNLNNFFYSELDKKLTIYSNNIYFAKHFSFGHFHRQFIENLPNNIIDSTVDFDKIFNQMHEINIKTINKNFNTNFQL